MSEGTKEKGKEATTGCGPQAEGCQSMMQTFLGKHFGSQMQEMVACCTRQSQKEGTCESPTNGGNEHEDE